MYIISCSLNLYVSATQLHENLRDFTFFFLSRTCLTKNTPKIVTSWMYAFPITLLTFLAEIINVKTSLFHLCAPILPESYCNHGYTLLHQPPVPEPAFGVMGIPLFSGCGHSRQRAFSLDPGPYSPTPLRVLEESAKPQAHLCNSSWLNFINSLTDFLLPDYEFFNGNIMTLFKSIF